MEKHEQEFVWPDDPNFRNFPKHLPDDCVEYAIHVFDTSLTTAALRSRLLEIQRAADKLQKDLLKGYIWQREAFNLSLSEPFTKLVTKKREAGLGGDKKLLLENEQDITNDAPLHLHGRCSFGDAVADEWLIVYILRELSKQFSATWIRVWDTDGEFLLIEAANALPKWVNPEVAEHRVWLHEGHLYIIPLHSKKKTKSSPPSESLPGLPRNINLSQALSYLSKHSQGPQDYPLLHTPAMEQEAFHRIRSHPSAIPSNLHTSVITIPRKVSYLLDRNQAWVSQAVEAFYLRDPIALKPLQIATAVMLPPEDFVDAPVRFQRVSFAQLRGQEFSPPPTWSNVIYTPQSQLAKKTNPDKGQERRDMGMKLTCGFEMLLSDPANKDSRHVREMRLVLSDLDDGEESLPTDEEIKQWRETRKEDSEEWLDVNFEDFERELRGEGATAADNQQASRPEDKPNPASGFGDKDAQDNLRRMVQRFEEFLKDEDDSATGVYDAGSDMDEMDVDDDEEGDSDASEEVAAQEEDEEGWVDGSEEEIDEEQLNEIIKEMQAMGLKPPPVSDTADDDVRRALMALADFVPIAGAGDGKGRVSRTQHFGSEWHPRVPNDNEEEEAQEASSSDEEEDEDVTELARAMETELRRSGALDLDASSSAGADGHGQDPRYMLAKHLLESYKGQGGMSGPAGNLMGALGVRMPRDEGDSGNGKTRAT